MDGLRAEGWGGLWLVSVNAAAAADGMEGYAENVDGPCLQDTEGDPVHALLGGEAYDIFVVDRHGCRRFEHSYLWLPENAPLLEGEARALLEEPL